MDEPLAVRLRRRIDSLGISDAEYGRRLGISASHLSGLLKGKIVLPRPDVRRRLATDLGLRHIDLLVAAGELVADEVPGHAMHEDRSTDDDDPLLREVAALPEHQRAALRHLIETMFHPEQADQLPTRQRRTVLERRD